MFIAIWTGTLLLTFKTKITMFQLPADQLSWLNELGPGNNIADVYGTETSKLQALELKKMIYDLTPQDFIDVKLFMMKDPIISRSHVYTYLYMPYQRKSAITPTLGSSLTTTAYQVVPITNPTSITIDMILNHPTTEQKVIVRAVDLAAYTMTIYPLDGATLPTLSSGSTYIFSQHGTVDGDLTNKVTQLQRVDEIIEKSNYVQWFKRGSTFGMIERYEYENNGTTDYMAKNDQNMLRQHHIDIGNATWNGTRGKVRLSDGNPALLMDGIVPQAIAGGALQGSCTVSQLFNTIIDGMESTRFGTGQQDKTIFATPKMISQFARQIKLNSTAPLVRFKATGDDGLSITLNGFEWQTGRVTFVPVQRWMQESASFPSSWENKVIVGNPETFQPYITFPESIHFIGGFDKNPYTENNFDRKFIKGTWSGALENPKDWLILTVN